MLKLSVVLPAYNEAHVLPRVVSDLSRELRRLEPSFEVVVVNNGSSDDTALALASLQKRFPELVVVSVHPNEGFGHGVLCGLQAARGEVLGWAGADGQLVAEEIGLVYKVLLETGSSFCKGERKQSTKDLARKVQSTAYTALFRFLFGPLSTDVNGSPKFIRRELLEKLHLESKDWFIDSECIIKAARAGHRPTEVPVVWRKREAGYSKVNIKAVFQFLKNMFVYKLKKGY